MTYCINELLKCEMVKGDKVRDLTNNMIATITKINNLMFCIIQYENGDIIQFKSAGELEKL